MTPQFAVPSLIALEEAGHDIPLVVTQPFPVQPCAIATAPSLLAISTRVLAISGRDRAEVRG